MGLKAVSRLELAKVGEHYGGRFVQDVGSRLSFAYHIEHDGLTAQQPAGGSRQQLPQHVVRVARGRDGADQLHRVQHEARQDRGWWVEA